LFDGVEQAVESPLRSRQRVPSDQEASECDRFNRLHLLPQPRQRSLPHGAQHFGVAPLSAASPGPKLAVHHPAACQELGQCRINHRHSEAESRADVLAGKWPVGPAEPADQIAHRIRDRLQERHRQAGRHRNTNRIAVAGCIFGGDKPLFAAGEAHREHPSRLDQLVDRRLGDPWITAQLDLGARQVAKPQQ
jgi:hypothetical protein